MSSKDLQEQDSFAIFLTVNDEHQTSDKTSLFWTAGSPFLKEKSL